MSEIDQVQNIIKHRGSNSLIPDFLPENLPKSVDDAYKIQKQYFIEHGTTLRGLMLYHKIDPDLFLDYVHKIDLSSINKNETLLNL